MRTASLRHYYSPPRSKCIKYPAGKASQGDNEHGDASLYG